MVEMYYTDDYIEMFVLVKHINIHNNFQLTISHIL
jgi:hypothetical protein